MSNMTRKFVAADISGDYTSDVIKGNYNNNSNNTRGVVQINFTSGTVDLQMRLEASAPWFTVKQYTASAIEEVVLANEMRIVVAGVAEAWISETL
jgi:archaeosine-15-forming tRNA-guanine transglycosylase